MTRKLSAAARSAVNAFPVPPMLAAAPPVAEPSQTIVARKRARRARTIGAPKVDPVIVRPEIDLTRKDARKALAAAFPTAIKGKILDATAADAIAAAAYLESRDAAARAEVAKEASGNVLRYRIGDGEEVHGEGWKATWKFQKGVIDWGAVVAELAIPSEAIERHRKPPSRILLVTETVEP